MSGVTLQLMLGDGYSYCIRICSLIHAYAFAEAFIGEMDERKMWDILSTL